jgi:hypothetical protein
LAFRAAGRRAVRQVSIREAFFSFATLLFFRAGPNEGEFTNR